MEFKGTKTKWKYEVKHGKNKPRITVQIPMTETYTKELILGTISEDDCTVACCCCTEDHANALLISKAPEMLEMLNELLKELAFHGFNNSTAIYNAKQLIEEATKID
jgi:iron only hydrogenase large subunit-like protein